MEDAVDRLDVAQERVSEPCSERQQVTSPSSEPIQRIPCAGNRRMSLRTLKCFQEAAHTLSPPGCGSGTRFRALCPTHSLLRKPTVRNPSFLIPPATDGPGTRFRALCPTHSLLRKPNQSCRTVGNSRLTHRGTTHSRYFSGRGAVRAEDAQGTPTQSHISPRLLVYEEKLIPF